LCVVSNWIIRVYTILVWNTISGSSNLDICCYHCLILTLIFHLKVLINFFFFFIFIIIIINSIIDIIIIITTITITITITIIITTTTTTSIIIIVIVVVVVVVIVIVTIVVVLLLFIIYTINLPVVRPRSCRVIITSTLLHLGEDINLLVVSTLKSLTHIGYCWLRNHWQKLSCCRPRNHWQKLSCCRPRNHQRNQVLRLTLKSSAHLSYCDSEIVDENWVVIDPEIVNVTQFYSWHWNRQHA